MFIASVRAQKESAEKLDPIFSCHPAMSQKMLQRSLYDGHFCKNR